MAHRKKKGRPNQPVEPVAKPPEVQTVPAPVAETIVDRRPFYRQPMFWLVILVAAAVRIPYLGKADLWGDEVIFVQDASPPLTPGEVFTKHVDEFLKKGHLPLPAVAHNMFLHLVKPLSDDILKDAFLQRMVGVIWGAITIPLYLMLLLRLVPRRVGWSAVAMMTFFFYPVHYSREAYVYAPLLFCGTATLLMLVKTVQQGRITQKDSILFFLAAAGSAYCHLTGALLLIAIFLLATFALASGKLPGGNAPSARKIGMRIWLLTLAAVAAVFLPFYKQKFTSNVPPHAWPEGLPPHENLYDLMGKIFMGSLLPWTLLGIALLVLGFVALNRQGARLYERRMLLWIGLMSFVAIFWGSVSTQYTPRYFYLVAGFFYLLYALGLDEISGWIGSKLRLAPSRVLTAVTAALVAVHVLFYLPNGYALTAKAKDFGRMSDWLMENLRPGTAYVFESGYDHYFVPGFFPTPGLVGAAPYIHQSQVDTNFNRMEMEKLREAQMRFFFQFPESAYIEASRHGTQPGDPYPVWEWPHRFFRNVVVLTNEPLKKLIKMGVYPPLRDNPINIQEYETPIWFNRAADVEALWAANNRPVLVTYPAPWACQQINQFTFAHMINQPRGTMVVKNLGSSPIRGKFQVSCGMFGADRSFKVDFRLDGASILETERWPRQLWSAETLEFDLTPGEHSLEWGVPESEGFGVQNLVMVMTEFIPAADTYSAPEVSIPLEP